MRRMLPLLALSLVPGLALAQERPDTILVLDGSGSMWGQIDGVNKIVIAREVVADLLADFPADENLGLVVYGHRTRGDCSDIESVIAPAPGTAPAIIDFVNRINPRGMTPMTDSVIAAAEVLRSTERPATVILVSDGIETCNPDPCAAARVLEETGVNFTAHVVGFDVAGEAEALAQMQCIAAETGGLFLTADNAEELTTALETVVAALEEPDYVVVPGTFTAQIGGTGSAADWTIGTSPLEGPLVEGPVLWTIASDSGVLVEDEMGNPLTLDLLEGTYRVTAAWLAGETEATTTFTVTGPADVAATVTFPSPPEPEMPGPLTLTVREGTANGPEVDLPVSWSIAPEGGGAATDLAGATVTAELPRGVWEVRVTRAADGATASQTIVHMSEAQTITLVLPPYRPGADVIAQGTAPMGATIQVGWEGPDERNDYIEIGRPGQTDYVNFTYTREGNPVELLMPPEAGTFEIRYIQHDGRAVLASRTITVTEVSATLDAAATAVAGSTLPVGWTGPDYRNDYIEIGRPGEEGYVNFRYTRDGNPAEVLMPLDPGDWELRYIMHQDRVVLGTRMVTLTPVTASLTAPATGVVGATVPVGWEGPDYRNDYIEVGRPGEEGYVNFRYTRDGNPAQLVMPTEAGTWAIRYIAHQDRRVLAETTITLGEVSASLEAPASATIGQVVPVGWTGPDYRNDYIGIRRMGEDRYVNYRYTRDGNPADLVMPSEPGDYEIAYFLAQGDEVLATRPITVNAAEVALTAPATGGAGETIAVAWVGPDARNDFIGVGLAGERYINYRYTRDGNPAQLRLPSEPGDYVITYYLGQDDTPLGSVPVTVTAQTASITAPAEAPAGSLVSVNWVGPAQQGDFLGIGKAGEGYGNWTYVEGTSPVGLMMPVEPGDYEIVYYLGQDETPLARTSIRVTPVTARLVAPATGIAGQPLAVGWDGPGNANDFLGIAPAGESGYIVWVMVQDGNPVTITLPDAPGDYDLRYFLGAEETPIGEPVRITVTAE